MIYNRTSRWFNITSKFNTVFAQKRGHSYLVSALSLLFIILSIVNFTGCCAYSFTGASVPEHIKTIALPISDDRSGSGEPGLAQSLTDKLTQQFIDDNTLQVTDRQNANSVLDCTILPLRDAPAVITGGENVAKRRITVSVQAAYRDLVKRKTVFDKTFSEYSDYSPEDGLSARTTAIDEAIDKITEDILLDTVSGW